MQVAGNRKTKWAPVPLSTLEMQKRASQVNHLRCACCAVDALLCLLRF